MSIVIRLAAEADADQIRAIYAPFVRDTAVSFELEPPSIEEMRMRISKTLRQHPWLACVSGETVLGYAYAGLHRARPAYQWAVDVSVYVAPAYRGRGIGRALYTVLLRILARQGLCAAFAGIALPNPASVRLHESLDFVPIGIYRGVGYKLGAWHDVGWWQCDLRPREAEPAPPLPLENVINSPDWQGILAGGLPLIRMRKGDHP
jgi:L-amino acid N-acyltransferase YncA